MRIVDEGKLNDILLHQIKNFWIEIDEHSILEAVPKALKAIEKNYMDMPNKRFWDGKQVVFSPYISTQWMNFLYRLSHEIYINSPKLCVCGGGCG